MEQQNQLKGAEEQLKLAPPNNTDPARNSRKAIMVVIIIAAAIGIWMYATSDQNASAPSENSSPAEDPYTAKDSLKKFSLTASFENSVVDGKPTATFDRKLKVTGTLKSGYLHVRASVNGRQIVSPDDVYINLTARVGEGTFNAFGGHLIAGDSLPTPPQSTATELFYDLAKVSYKERFFNNNTEVKTADWLTVLNHYDNQRIVAFISTVGEGAITELHLYYDCAEGSECIVEFQE